MSGDFSRKTFDPQKHYNGVLMQEGRVQLDADWNEQLDIQQHRTFTETRDIIGPAGVPKHNNGFNIGISSSGSELVISQGRIYVGGLLCELGYPPITTYFNQPYYPNPDTGYFVPTSPPFSPPASPISQPLYDIRNLMDGTYLVYLDAWIRDVNYLDDPHIHEVALGQADTATRTQTVWQVKLLRVSSDDFSKVSCSTYFPDYEKITAPTTGKMNAQTIKAPDQTNPCVLPPGSGYRRLENQLYRVEIQRGGDQTTSTFKWSRDNASIETSISGIVNNTLTVTDVGKDEVLGFAGDQWVEIVDEESSLKGKPNDLVQIDHVNPGTLEIVLKTSAKQYIGKAGLKLRRWDQSGTTSLAQGISMTSGWVELEDGVEVKFSEGTYHAGDYWLIPARTATGDIEWPTYDIPGNFPIEQSPLGIKHHYCCLALLNAKKHKITLSDCRKLFPTITEMFSLVQNGEGQQRLTRTCLIGFGIVCGLTVKPLQNTATGGVASLGVTKGYGLTSEGYLITQSENKTYDKYRVFNAAKKTYYDRFVNLSTHNQKFDLWELREDSATATADDIFIAKNPDFLADKAVLLFVEIVLFDEGYNQSCDDNGKTARLTIRPLLIEKADLQTITKTGTGPLNFGTLQQLKLPRFNVDGKALNTAQDIFAAYQSIITKKFLAEIDVALSKSYTSYSGLVADIYPLNPFADLGDTFNYFMQVIKKSPVIIQYFYDFYSDLEQAYNELAKVGFSINQSGCLPTDPFPRHVVLGNAIAGKDDFGNNNRTYFTPSPLLEKQYEKVQELRLLFRRLVLMIDKFVLAIKQENTQSLGVIITPSKLGDFTLAQKAVPFYYFMENDASALFNFWSYEKSLHGIADQNLSYNSQVYAKQDFVTKPLGYDLEPYNFLRIEGALGNQYEKIAPIINDQIKKYRLPIKLIGLQTGSATAVGGLANLGAFLNEHPGIQHKAGVPMGGTFVLVYKGASDKLEEEIKSGTIIADFFLPYICCSTQPTVRTVFTIDPTRFLFDDATNYPFTISPVQSSIDDIGNNSKLNLLIDEKNQLLLHPAMALDSTLQATLTYNEVSLDVTIVKPDAAFTVTITKTIDAATGAQIVMVQLAAVNKDANAYEWTVNKRVTTLFQNVAAPPAINLNQIIQLNLNLVTIELEITYIINDQTSTDLNIVNFTLDEAKAIPVGGNLTRKSKEE